MQVNASDLKISIASEKGNTGVFVFEPLPTGFGHTMGNSLKRILLTSLEGSAITQVKIAGADHQFTTVSGVKEDIVEITLNLKKVRFLNHSQNPVAAAINKKGPGSVTAGDIEVSSEVEVLNKDLVLCTLNDKNATFKADIVIEKGTGYSPMEERQTSKIGVIVLDASYSPIITAHYEVEPTRFGKMTNLDKITLTVETDGSTTAKDAVIKSGEILKNFYARVNVWEDEIVETDEEEQSKTASPKVKAGESTAVEELPLPTRTVNALKKQGIDTLEELAGKSDEELSDIKNLGEKSVLEIKKLLKKEGLRA
ncbi:MAG: DNA-directed RNA polymerase subunit alpha [uncultured bacterium]|nr:MAG: DNA-directed RNA polymerase subunit alpha [uncultured bacterium]